MGSIKSRFKIVITGLLITTIIVTSSISSLALRADLGDGYQSEVYGFNVDESGVYLEKDAVNANGVSYGDVIHIPVYVGHGDFLGQMYNPIDGYTSKFLNGEVYRSIYFSDYMWDKYINSMSFGDYYEWGEEIRGYSIQFEGYSTPQEYLDDLRKIGWKELNEIIDNMPEDKKVKLDETYADYTIISIDNYLKEKLLEQGVATEDGKINLFTVDENSLEYDKYLKEYNNMYNNKQVKIWAQPFGSTYEESSQVIENYYYDYSYMDYYGYRYDLFNHFTIKIDETMPIFETSSSNSSLITAARGDEIKVGDYLSPGALIYNTYNEDTDTIQKYILYEAPQVKKKASYLNGPFENIYSSFILNMTEDYKIENEIVIQVKLSNGAILDCYSIGKSYTYYLSQYDSSYDSNWKIDLLQNTFQDGSTLEQILVTNEAEYLYTPIEETNIDIKFARQIFENEADKTSICTNYKNEQYDIERYETIYKNEGNNVSYYDNSYSENEYSLNNFVYEGASQGGKSLLIKDTPIQNMITGELFFKVKEGCYGNHLMYITDNSDEDNQLVLEFDILFTGCNPSYNLAWGSAGQTNVYKVPTGTKLGKIQYEKPLTYVFCSPFGKHYPVDGYQSEDVYSYLIEAPNMDLNLDSLFTNESYAVAKLHEGYFTEPAQVRNIFSYNEFVSIYGLSDGNQLPDGEIIGKDYIAPTYNSERNYNSPKLSGYPEGYFDNVTFIELAPHEEKLETKPSVNSGKSDENSSPQPVKIPSVYFKTQASIEGQKFILNGNKQVTLTDTVTYKGYGQNGASYIMEGYLVDKKTGQPYKDATGKLVASSMKYQQKDEETVVAVTFTFDSTNLNPGDSLVVYEYMKDENGNIIANHADIYDENQTVYVKGYTQVQTGVYPQIIQGYRD